jgi:hypothetical protein
VSASESASFFCWSESSPLGSGAPFGLELALQAVGRGQQGANSPLPEQLGRGVAVAATRTGAAARRAISSSAVEFLCLGAVARVGSSGMAVVEAASYILATASVGCSPEWLLSRMEKKTVPLKHANRLLQKKTSCRIGGVGIVQRTQ